MENLFNQTNSQIILSTIIYSSNHFNNWTNMLIWIASLLKMEMIHLALIICLQNSLGKIWKANKKKKRKPGWVKNFKLKIKPTPISGSRNTAIKSIGVDMVLDLYGNWMVRSLQ